MRTGNGACRRRQAFVALAVELVVTIRQDRHAVLLPIPFAHQRRAWHQMHFGTASDFDLRVLLATVGQVCLDLGRQTTERHLLQTMGQSRFQIMSLDVLWATREVVTMNALFDQEAKLIEPEKHENQARKTR